MHAKFETALAARDDIDTTTRALFLQEVDRCTALLADLRFETVVEVVLHLLVSDLCDAAVSAKGDAAVSATGDAAGAAVNAMLDDPATSFPATLLLRNGMELVLDAAMLKDAAQEVGKIATTGKRHAKLNALRSVTRALVKKTGGMSFEGQGMVGITPGGM